MNFWTEILEGIPKTLPPEKPYDLKVNHAPKRKKILSSAEEKLALNNALRYFDPSLHSVLAREFLDELRNFGRIYMYRYRPDHKIFARSISEYKCRSSEAAAIMLMIQNNLDENVAQHPHELITYGGNGAVFQNWAQYRLTLSYLAKMKDDQTLVMYSGHPLGLFPSHKGAPRVVVTNGMVIPNYSKPDDWERMNALGVSQYGQMTAGSYMYIGPQGIVHGTTITLLGAGRRKDPKLNSLKGQLFVSSGLGGMSGAQAKAAVIAGAIGVIAEVNLKAIEVRHSQGWVDEVFSDLEKLLLRIEELKKSGTPRSLAFAGNVVDLWEYLAKKNVKVDIGSDQTSLHNPYAGGYYPAGLSFEESQRLMSENPEAFKDKVGKSLLRHAETVSVHVQRGTYFFDYGNAFLLEASRAGAKIVNEDGDFMYPSYVQDIMGPQCFDFGFGPFRWVCASGNDHDLEKTDAIAISVLKKYQESAPESIQGQLRDNIRWIESAQQNNLVVGSKARILYADARARITIAHEFNESIKRGEISPVILGRDHHDVSGTDSPYRETYNIYDGSKFTADMAVQNFVGDAIRGATWVSLHNGGGVGWGEVINGGFGLLLQGTEECGRKASSMLGWDVYNGVARRSWARNPGAIEAIKSAPSHIPGLEVTMPNLVDEKILDLLDIGS